MTHKIEIIGDEVQYYFYDKEKLGVRTKEEFVEWLKEQDDYWSEDCELAYAKIYSLKIDGRPVRLSDEFIKHSIEKYSSDCGYAYFIKRFKREGEFESDEKNIDPDKLFVSSVNYAEYDNEPFELLETQGAWYNMRDNQYGAWWDSKIFRVKFD